MKYQSKVRSIHVSPLLKFCIGCECPIVSPSGWQFLLTDVSTTWRRVILPPSSNRRATLVTGSVYARRRRACSMFLAPNTWPSVAVRSVQLQLVCGTVCQRQCKLLSHWTFFDAAWKLNCSSVLTTDTAPVKRLYCCFLLWPQPWSLLTIMLLWHSFVIIIIIIIIIIITSRVRPPNGGRNEANSW